MNKKHSVFHLAEPKNDIPDQLFRNYENRSKDQSENHNESVMISNQGGEDVLNKESASNDEQTVPLSAPVPHSVKLVKNGNVKI
jgi:hypothetical protein